MCLKLTTGLVKCIHCKSQFNWQRTEPNKMTINYKGMLFHVEILFPMLVYQITSPSMFGLC